ncbi:MAG: efflux RND transporter periplasmic adaptor subunit [Pseudomonadota bacterium]
MKLKIILPILILVLAAFAMMSMINMRPQAKQKPVEIVPPLVEAISAKRESVPLTVHSQGTVTPRTETMMISEVSGQITEVAQAFFVGGFFQKGDVLLRVDDRNYRSALKRAEASVASAKSNLVLEQGRAEIAYEDWKRYPKPDRSQKGTELALRKPQLAEAEANLEFAEADLERAQGDLDRTVIRAPYDGLIKEKRADMGQFVSAGSPLAVTFAVDYAEVRLPLTEAQLSHLDLPGTSSYDPENPPMVRLMAKLGNNDFTWQGALTRTEAVFDTSSRVLHGVVQVQDPYGLQAQRAAPLLIGAFVKAEIQGRTLSDVIILPRQAVRHDNTLWMIDETSSLRSRAIEILHNDGETIYIGDGVDIGETICLTKLADPLPGTKVRIATAGAGS